MRFHLADGTTVPSVTPEPMREVDRLAVPIALADIGVAPELYRGLGLEIGPICRSGCRVPLFRS